MFIRCIAPIVYLTTADLPTIPSDERLIVPEYVKRFLIPAGVPNDQWGSYIISQQDMTTGDTLLPWCIASVDIDKVAELRASPGYFIFPDYALDAKCLDLIPVDMTLCLAAMNTHGVVATTGVNVTNPAQINGITNGSKYREFIERIARHLTFGQWDHANGTMLSDMLG